MSATTTHPLARRKKLRRAGLSEAAELSDDAAALLDAAPPDLNERQLREIAQGHARTEPTERRPTIASEALRLLRERGPMHYRKLAEAILAEERVKPRGKTFSQTLSATLTRHPEVERVEPGVFKAKGGGEDA